MILFTKLLRLTVWVESFFNDKNSTTSDPSTVGCEFLNVTENGIIVEKFLSFWRKEPSDSFLAQASKNSDRLPILSSPVMA